MAIDPESPTSLRFASSALGASSWSNVASAAVSGILQMFKNKSRQIPVLVDPDCPRNDCKLLWKVQLQVSVSLVWVDIALPCFCWLLSFWISARNERILEWSQKKPGKWNRQLIHHMQLQMIQRKNHTHRTAAIFLPSAITGAMFSSAAFEPSVMTVMAQVAWSCYTFEVRLPVASQDQNTLNAQRKTV